MKRVVVPLSTSGIAKLLHELTACERDIERKAKLLIDRLAQEGMQIAQFGFNIGVYDGTNDVKVDIKERGDMCTAVVATGTAVLFLEFGAGYYLGGGHPEPMGFGPGTYPGQTHAFDPNGWYLPKAVKEATGIEHSIGNAPTAAMYNSKKELEMNLQRIAAEVFND